MRSGLAARKAAARKAASARRAAAHAEHKLAASAALLAYLSGLSGRIVAGYLPIRTEADPLPAMTALAEITPVCVPVVEGRDRPLAFREWRPGCALEEGPYRVMVPSAGVMMRPEILIVPLLAYDGDLFRLGYGGGFYDRTLQALRDDGPVRAVGFAYRAQRDDALPLESTDQRLDEVVTEGGVLRHAS